MTLHSRMLEVCKRLDGALGAPLMRHAGDRRPLPRRPPRDVLLVRLWGLGNLALLAPVLSAPDRPRLRLLTLRRNARFLARHFPGVGVLTVPEPFHPAFLPAVGRLARTLRRKPPDVIVDLEQFLCLPLALVRAACPAPAVGLDTPGQGRAPLLDRPVAAEPMRHTGDTFAALCRAAGLPAPRGPGGLRVLPAARREVLRWLGPVPGKLVVLHPGTGDHFPGRRWPARRFGRLAAALVAQTGARVLVTGVRAERRLVATVLHEGGPGVRSVAGLWGVEPWVALLGLADLVVTNDTAPVHLADALGTPVVALFGPNSPHRYGPRRPGSRALWADLPCSPCLGDRSRRSSPCRHHACMTDLPEPRVRDACLELLAAPRRADPPVHRAVAR